MTTPIGPICFACKYLRKFDRKTGVYTCLAFPEAIPASIVFNRVDHRKPIDGDHGIQFVQNPDRAELSPIYDQLFAAKEKSNAVAD